MKKICSAFFGLSFFMASAAYSAETKPSSLEIIGKTHTIAAFNSFSGPGATVKNLANTYDMSIFQFNWGGKQSLFNGSGITTNSNFPLTDGEAITNNTHIGLSSKLTDEMNAGFVMELYGLIGDKIAGP